jgi:hypothetical protein
MRLYFNGCSHTYGDDLANRDQAWPAVIAKQLGFEFLNDSVSGGTNDRIMYRTIKYADQFDKFYIAWTYTSRFTKYRSDNNYEVNFNPQLVNTLYGKDPEFVVYGKTYYRTWHNELYTFKLWLQNIILLQRFFESIKKPYVMINSTDNLINRWCSDRKYFNNKVQSLLCFDLMNDEQLYVEYLEIQSLVDQINFDHYIGWGTWTLVDVMKTHPVGPTGHLLSSGHHATAQHLLIHDSN